MGRYLSNALSSIFIIFFCSCCAAPDKYSGFKEEIKYSFAYWNYWFGPLLKKSYPDTIYDFGKETKYEIWKCEGRPHDFFVFFPSIHEGEDGLFELTFSENPIKFWEGDIGIIPKFGTGSSPFEHYSLISRGVIDVSEKLSEIIRDSDSFNDVQVRNIKDWLKKYLRMNKIRTPQKFYVIPNKKYFSLVDIYWPSKKMVLEAGNDSFDFPHKDLWLEKMLEIPVEIDANKLAPLKLKFIVTP